MKSLRNIPAIDELLADERVKTLISRYARDLVVNKAREVVAGLRDLLKNSDEDLTRSEITTRIINQLSARLYHCTRGTLRKVINATGVVLHTNLGRAVLSPAAIRYVNEVASSYTNLEIDLDKGERGSRYSHVEDLLKTLTGAEAALVVNNNAAAVLLALNTLASGREVIVSRGQLVEIGGAFRVPEVMRSSGARLVEVGTTNKTYRRDFEQALTTETALLLAVHTSNYRIVGFTEEVPLAEMVSLGRSTGLPVMQDLGSGVLYDLSSWGLAGEPTVQECVRQGVDVVTFSGDKLLGGPQAGIIVGRAELVERMKRNQLTRALRVDKLTIAALEGTLLEYLNGEPRKQIPVLAMLTASPEELAARATRLCGALEAALGPEPRVKFIRVVETEDRVGGGAYPIHNLPGYGVEISFSGDILSRVARNLRIGEPAVLTRLQDNHMIISVRTLRNDDEQLLVTRLVDVLGGNDE
ncbi:MAG: L-seryl-tRNA(Sec) selenium transferase [Syntrophomonadaceae bacterium]|nr:L-seryl-tRNA(Sec) selenium transferase [Syntrophomonadaceae bacterium]